jgi:hypothetical protein
MNFNKIHFLNFFLHLTGSYYKIEVLVYLKELLKAIEASHSNNLVGHICVPSPLCTSLFHKPSLYLYIL